MVQQAIENGSYDNLVAEKLSPIAEGFVGRYDG
jgi:hypothetical protein